MENLLIKCEKRYLLRFTTKITYANNKNETHIARKMSKETQISFPKHIFWHLCIQGWRFFILKLFSICLQTYTKLIYTGLLIKKALFRAILNHCLLFKPFGTKFGAFYLQLKRHLYCTIEFMIYIERLGHPFQCKGRSFHQNIQIAQIIQIVSDPMVDYQIIF